MSNIPSESVSLPIHDESDDPALMRLRPDNPFSDDEDEADGVPQERINKYATSLKLRVDIEAALCYMLLCFSGILLLILETKNDYVRFHAWQSTLMFSILFIIHFVVSLISSFLTWIVFWIIIGAAIFYAFMAYIGAESLTRHRAYYVGQFADQWTDAE